MRSPAFQQLMEVTTKPPLDVLTLALRLGPCAETSLASGLATELKLQAGSLRVSALNADEADLHACSLAEQFYSSGSAAALALAIGSSPDKVLARLPILFSINYDQSKIGGNAVASPLRLLPGPFKDGEEVVPLIAALIDTASRATPNAVDWPPLPLVAAESAAALRTATRAGLLRALGELNEATLGDVARAFDSQGERNSTLRELVARLVTPKSATAQALLDSRVKRALSLPPAESGGRARGSSGDVAGGSGTVAGQSSPWVSHPSAVKQARRLHAAGKGCARNARNARGFTFL